MRDTTSVPRAAVVKGRSCHHDFLLRRPGAMPQPCRSSRRNNERMQASTPLRALETGVGAEHLGHMRSDRRSSMSVRALRALGAVGLLGVLTTVFLITAGAATLVPGQGLKDIYTGKVMYSFFTDVRFQF